MKMPLRFLLPGLMCLTAGAARADEVLNWNKYLRQVMQWDSAKANPGWSTRAMAMMNCAIYDCFQAVHRTHKPYHVDKSAPNGVSAQAAAIEAAYTVAAKMYPAHNSWLSWARGAGLRTIADSPAKEAGQALGVEIANEYIEWRKTDGADGNVQYVPSNLPGRWRPDPIFQPPQQAWGPEWGSVKTFTVLNSQQFKPGAPPAMNSAAYTAAWNEVKNYGAKDSAVRTEDQRKIGLFWAYDRSGMGPPPVLYSRSLWEIALQRGNSEEDNARLFAFASVAQADAAITAWDVKFEHDVWRPIGGIREADTDGNPDTTAIPDWEPLGCPGSEAFPNFTPPFPAYVSGHASMGEAVFAAMELFYGTDDMEYVLTSEEVYGEVRNYTKLSQAAQENADSRVYLGVHWRFDQTGGQKVGRDVANYVFTHAFQPVGVAGEDFAKFATTHGLTGLKTDDFDKDGNNDFAEYAFGTNPALRDTLPAGKYEMMGATACVIIRYSLRPGRGMMGLTLTPELSDDMQTWSTGGITDEVDPAAEQTAEVQNRRAWVPVTGATKRFLRLKASQPQ